MPILIKLPKGECDLNYYCEMEYKRINLIMKLIEDEFNVDLNNHQNLRHEILNISNFIRRLPIMVSEVGPSGRS